MMGKHYIQLGINLNEELGLKSVTIDYNTTGLPNDSELLKLVAMTILKAIVLNKESVAVQDLLNDLDITIGKD